MNKKIVFYHLLNNYTGSPLILRNIIEIALQEGYEVDVYTSSGKGFLSDIDGVNYFNNFYRRSGYRSLTFFSFFFSQFFLILPLLFKYRKADTIFYVNTILPFVNILVGRLLGHRVITHVHEYEIQPKSLNNFLFGIVRKYSSDIVAVSEFLKSNPFLRNRDVEVIYNCVSSSFEEKAIVKMAPNLKFNLLMLASLRPYKGIMEFLELSKRLPDLSFTLVVSESEKEVKDFLTRNPIPKNFQLHAVQKDVHPFYQNADLILNLTKPRETIETFGMTVLEGMYYGLPAIVPPIGGITELVVHGKNGFQYSCENLNEIETTIQFLANNPREWQRINKNVLTFKEKFSRPVFKDQINILLNKQLNNFS